MVEICKTILQRGGDPLILCFVDFINPACAATALSALQGTKFLIIITTEALFFLQFFSTVFSRVRNCSLLFFGGIRMLNHLEFMSTSPSVCNHDEFLIS